MVPLSLGAHRYTQVKNGKKRVGGFRFTLPTLREIILKSNI